MNIAGKVTKEQRDETHGAIGEAIEESRKHKAVSSLAHPANTNPKGTLEGKYN